MPLWNAVQRSRCKPKSVRNLGGVRLGAVKRSNIAKIAKIAEIEPICDRVGPTQGERC